MMRKFLTLLLILSHNLLWSQTNFNKEWMLGGPYDFLATFSSGQVSINIHGINRRFSGGHSNICDSNGNLILCSDGYNVYDKNLNYIEDGDTLVPVVFYNDRDGWSDLAQNSIFLPFDSNIYYLITPTMSDSHFVTYVNSADIDTQSRASFDLLLSHKIDMRVNNGAGKVVVKAKELLSNVLTDRVRMIACKHANGKDWWVLKNATDTNMIYTFLVKQDTIEGPMIQGFAEPHFGRQRCWANNFGQSVFSQDGTKYISGGQGNLDLFFANFDRCHGVLMNPNVIHVPIDSPGTIYVDSRMYGLAFSSNGQFIYIMKGNNLWQLDLQDSDSITAWYRVATNFLNLPNWQYATSIGLAPDNKIYLGNRNGLSNLMSVIDNPDVKGAGCNFCAQCLVFPQTGVSSPPCMPNYELGAKTCWPLSNGELLVVSDELVVYPNPTFGKFQIKNSKYQSVKELYNSVGQMVLSTKENEMEVSHLSKGVYYLRFENKSVKVVVE